MLSFVTAPPTPPPGTERHGDVDDGDAATDRPCPNRYGRSARGRTVTGVELRMPTNLGGTAMVAILDLKGTLGAMPTMQGRRPESTEAERKATGAFVTLAPFRDGNIYSAKFSGDAAWERHPNGDELVQIIEGATTVDISTDEGPLSVELTAGMTVVAPQRASHRFHAPNAVTIVTATPRPTEHLTADSEDPR